MYDSSYEALKRSVNAAGLPLTLRCGIPPPHPIPPTFVPIITHPMSSLLRSRTHDEWSGGSDQHGACHDAPGRVGQARHDAPRSWPRVDLWKLVRLCGPQHKIETMSYKLAYNAELLELIVIVFENRVFYFEIMKNMFSCCWCVLCYIYWCFECFYEIHCHFLYIWTYF